MAALQNTDYSASVGTAGDARRERAAGLRRGAFVVTIPPDFSRDLVRGERPQMLVEADASDPAAASNALAALSHSPHGARRDLSGPLAQPRTRRRRSNCSVHRRYNPEGITQYNIVPGLIGVILT